MKREDFIVRKIPWCLLTYNNHSNTFASSVSIWYGDINISESEALDDLDMKIQYTSTIRLIK